MVARHQVEDLVAGEVELRMHRGHLAGGLGLVLEDAHRVQRLRVELHLDRRLGQGQVVVGDLGDADLGAVGDLGREDRLHALEHGAAGVGGELGVADAAGGAGLVVGARRRYLLA
jgi:hypothetical protein